MVEGHGQEDHVEKLQHEVVGNEVVAVELWIGEDQVQSEGRSGMVV